MVVLGLAGGEGGQGWGTCSLQTFLFPSCTGHAR